MNYTQLQTINLSGKQNSELLTTTIVDKKNLQQVALLWNKLESQISTVGLSCKWDWIQTWLNHYGDVVDYWFVVSSIQNDVYGIALITKETHRPLPIPVKAFHIGTNGEPYQEMVRMINNKVLVKESFKKLFYVNLVETIMEHFKWEEIVFDLYNEQEILDLQELLLGKNLHVSVDTESCWEFNLDEPRKFNTDVLTQYSHSTRYAIRKTLTALDNNVTTEWAETAEQGLDILQDLIILYEKKWKAKGTKGMFASKRFLAFQKEIITKLVPTGDVVLFRVRNSKLGTIGCLFLYIDNGVAYGYQIGLDDFEDVQFPTINKKHFKPGFLLHLLFTEECLKRGLKAYNFSTGYYPYKSLLTNKQNNVVSLYIRRRITPYVRENIMKFHYKLIHNKNAAILLKPLRMFR